MSFTAFRDIAKESGTRISDSPLGKLTEGKTFDRPMSEYDKPLGYLKIIENKRDGTKREEDVSAWLKEKYSEVKGFQVIREAYLRDKDGNIVKDNETGEARRIDFVIVKDGNVVESIEVTSKTAPKDEQCAKESRIRENGGNYIKVPDGSLAEFSRDITTTIERRD